MFQKTLTLLMMICLFFMFHIFCKFALADGNSIDPFFLQPQGLLNYSLGQIIQSRLIEVNKTALPTLKNIRSTYQIVYRSQGFDQSQPQANVLTLFVPENFNQTLPIELVLVSAAYDSDNPECGPSRSILNGKSVPELVTIGMNAEKGRLYAFADYEGPKAAFTQGNVAAAGNIDALRAILQFTEVIPIWQRNKTKIGLEGYSGGGLAVAWTLQRLPSYGQELLGQVVGAAMGGVPSNSTEVALYQDASEGAGFAIAGLFGQASVDDRIQSWINSHTVHDQIKIAKQYTDALCVEDLLLPFLFQELASVYFNLTKGEVLKDFSFLYGEGTVAVPSTQSYPVYPIPVPILLIQAIVDQFIPVEMNDQYYQRLCQADTDEVSVTYLRNSNGKHIQTAILSVPYAALFLQDRFDGVDPIRGCQMENQSLTLDDPRFLKEFGRETMERLKEALADAALLE